MPRHLERASPSDDATALPAMPALLAPERVKTEGLSKTIRELQRFRFGRQTGSLAPDQFQLEMEEAD